MVTYGGAFLDTIGDHTTLRCPLAAAIDRKTDELFVVNSQFTSVSVFRISNGQFIKTIVGRGHYSPCIAISSTNIFIVDGDQLAVIDRLTGTFAQCLSNGIMYAPYRIAMWYDHMYVCDQQRLDVYKQPNDLSKRFSYHYHGQIGCGGWKPGQYSETTDLAFTDDQHIVVSDSFAAKLQIFS